MKRISLSLILVFTIVAAKAQDAPRTSWPPMAVLPEKHDWSIGIDVIPVFTGIGNVFHSPSGNDTIFSQKQYTLVGLYMNLLFQHVAFNFFNLTFVPENMYNSMLGHLIYVVRLPPGCFYL